MTRTFKNLTAAICGGLVVLSAASAAMSFDTDEAKCRKTISKNVQKVMKTASKAITGCHGKRNKNSLPPATDCSDLSVADANAKVPGARTTMKTKVTGSCNALPDNDVLDQYVSCSASCSATAGPGNTPISNPITSFADLADCLSCMAAELVEANHAVFLGLPTTPVSSPDQTCHKTIAKGWSKHLLTYHKERAKCQDNLEKNGLSNGLGDSTCDTQAIVKIDDSSTSASSGTTGSCSGGVPASFNLTGGCAAANTAGLLNACALAQNGTNGTGDGGTITGATYELAADTAAICPVRVDSLIRAGVGVGGNTNSFLDVGYTGMGHYFDVPDDYFLSADLTCAASPPCGDCTVDGLSLAGPQYQAFSRCIDDFSIPCSPAFANNVGCPAGGLCTYVLGPPLPLSAANNPTCNINTLAQNITGTANPATGSGELTVELRTRVHLGIAKTQPCPVCSGDPTAGDDVQGGTCSGGVNTGNPCDTQAFDETFASQSNGEGLSLDCPPSPGANISGAGLNIPIEFTTGTSSLPFAAHCDAPLQFLLCPCAVCSLATSKGCVSNADCGVGEGTCDTNGGGQAAQRLPNSCSDLICTDVGGGKGECQAGVIDVDDIQYCDGQLKANGRGYLVCLSQGDCDVADPECNGGDCGTCGGVTEERPCFNDPIDVTGIADPSNPNIAATFCIPPTSNAAINGAAGTPSAGRVVVDQLTTLVYK
jgi:hypothetical protein